jgi:hypothetical protein
MNYPPVAGIDVGKNFSEMCILSPNNEIYHRIKIYHDSIDSIQKGYRSIAKSRKGFCN